MVSVETEAVEIVEAVEAVEAAEAAEAAEDVAGAVAGHNAQPTAVVELVDDAVPDEVVEAVVDDYSVVQIAVNPDCP